MHIAWGTVAAVAVVAAAAALTVVLLVSFALVGLSDHRRRETGGPEPGRESARRLDVGRAVAVLCLFAAGLVVSYGLYLIIA